MVHETVKIYRDAQIDNSSIEKYSTIGEFSRVKNSRIEEYCYVDRQNLLLNVELGMRSYTGPFDMIFHSKIGRYCSISYGVTIGAPEHNYKRISTHPFIYDPKFGVFAEDKTIREEKFAAELEIGNDVWAGCNSTILRGVKVHDGAVIAANAVVTQDVPPYAIVAGVPARVIKFRFPTEIIERLLDLKWWMWDDEKIQKNADFFKSPITMDTINNIM